MMLSSTSLGTFSEPQVVQNGVVDLLGGVDVYGFGCVLVLNPLSIGKDVFCEIMESHARPHYLLSILELNSTA